MWQKFFYNLKKFNNHKRSHKNTTAAGDECTNAPPFLETVHKNSHSNYSSIIETENELQEENKLFKEHGVKNAIILIENVNLW